MKKVLIIAHLLRASPRIPGLVKYLPEFGWEPIVLTPAIGTDPDSGFGPSKDFIKSGVRIVETQYADTFDSYLIKKFGLNPVEGIEGHLEKRFGVTSKRSFVDFLLTRGREIIWYPDRDKGWRKIAVEAGNELLQNEDIDAIISSSSPITSHIIAKELRGKYKILWIADLRDLWSQNLNYTYGPLRKKMDRRLELKTLLPADALITVSQPLAEELQALHRGKTTYTITNGFDPDKMNDGQGDLTSKFTITYTGQIYTIKQDPLKLLVALRDLISDETMSPDDVEVRFYGPKYEWLAREIEENELSNIVKQYGMIPRQNVLEKQRESQVLLLLNWEEQRKSGVYTTKIFEYLAAQRPILATGGSGEDVIKELLDETNAGVYVKGVEDIKDILRELYSEYKSKGEISYTGDIEKINKYSYREMAGKFAEVLDSLT